jgi:hypothetical protein
VRPVAVIVPSRERAARIGACVEAFYATSTLATMYVCVDYDDPQLADYPAAMAGKGVLMVGPSMRCVPKLQWAWERLSPARIIGFHGDDTLARTPGWDEKMLAAAREMGGWAFLHPHDGAVGERHMIHPFMTGNIPETLGYFGPPGYLHVWVDNHYDRLARESGLHRFLPDVLFQHQHYSYGEAKEDATYERGNNREAWNAGESAFNAWVGGGLQRDLARLRGAMG